MSTTLLTARDVADYFLANVDEESGDNITNLKLQKLLYYAQGFHVAMHDGEPLFPESLLRWKHGPVVKTVWSAFQNLGWNPIGPPTAYLADEYAPEVKELLDAVYLAYGQYTAKKLEAMTHEESPWQKTRHNGTISLDLLREYFSTLVQAAKVGEVVNEHPPWPINSFRFQGRTAMSARMAPHRARLRAIRERYPSGDDW